MIDEQKLKDGLSKLRGLDFEAAESQERLSGNNFPDVTFSRTFQARMAALALGMNVHDIKGLPMREYNRVCQTVFNFFYSTSGDEISAEQSEASPLI